MTPSETIEMIDPRTDTFDDQEHDFMKASVQLMTTAVPKRLEVLFDPTDADLYTIDGERVTVERARELRFVWSVLDKDTKMNQMGDVEVRNYV